MALWIIAGLLLILAVGLYFVGALLYELILTLMRQVVGLRRDMNEALEELREEVRRDNRRSS